MTSSILLQRATRDGVVCCELCGEPVEGERGVGWALHHRRFRDGRPDSHSPQNLLLVHGASNTDSCHGRIHGNKTEAMANGWAITRHGNADPLTEPVLIDGGRRKVLLTADGGYVDVTVSAPTVCPTCLGEGFVEGISSFLGALVEVVCTDCCCLCGVVTGGGICPECRDDIADDTTMRRLADV